MGFLRHTSLAEVIAFEYGDLIAKAQELTYRDQSMKHGVFGPHRGRVCAYRELEFQSMHMHNFLLATKCWKGKIAKAIK